MTELKKGFGQMRVLLIGGGGREDAIAWKLAKSKELEKAVYRAGKSGHGQMGRKRRDKGGGCWRR